MSIQVSSGPQRRSSTVPSEQTLFVVAPMCRVGNSQPCTPCGLDSTAYCPRISPVGELAGLRIHDNGPRVRNGGNDEKIEWDRDGELENKEEKRER